MQTYSHLLLTAVSRHLLRKAKIADPKTAVLLGSFAPDMPLTLITAGYTMQKRRQGSSKLFGEEYDRNYFNNPVWITAHNLFHAPFCLLLIAIIGGLGVRRGKAWGTSFIWFTVGCGFHTLLDIFTHVNDGPALLYPFNWRYRYRASVSYWDPRYGGQTFARYEFVLDIVLILYLIYAWYQNKTSS